MAYNYNSLNDGSYDKGATPASQNAGTLAQLQILAKQNPEILNDPSIQASMSDPTKLQTALQAWQHTHGMDPNNTYDDKGTLQNGSWFSDHLPLIAALMGAGLAGPAALAALGVGGGAAGAGAAATAGAAGAESGGLASASLLGGLGTTVPIAGGIVPAAVAGAGGAAAAGGAGAFLPSTTIGTGMSPAITGGTGSALSGAAATGATAGTGAGQSILSRLTSGGLSSPLGLAAKGLAGFAQSQAGNRGSALGATQNEDQIRLNYDADNRAAQNDARKQLFYDNFIQNPTTPNRPSYLPPSGLIAPPAPSDAMKQNAAMNQQSILSRMANPLQPTGISQYLNPSTGENIAGYGSLGLSVLPTILSLLH